MYDITIIGAGVVGCSIARALSKYDLSVCVLEKDNDVASGTSKANSAIVHPGEDPIPGTLKAKLNVRGNAMFDKLSEELDFPFKRNGSFVLCLSEDEIPELKEYSKRGIANGVKLEFLNRQQALEKEPNLSDEVVAALFFPTGGIVCPYEMTIALAENAFTNGVEFKLETEVVNIIKEKDKYIIETNKGNIESKIVINAAGIFSDVMNNFVSEKKIKIIPRRGQYCLFDKVDGSMIKSTLFQLPTKLGKGVLVTPTVDGNLLVGPDAEDLEDKYDLETTQEGLDFIISKARKSVKDIPMRDVITSFAGLRAHTGGDFIIGEVEDAPNFINAAGIESPGLTSSPAIGEMIEEIIVKKLNPRKNENFNPIRKGVPKFRELSNEERRKLIAENPQYGKIICRCETVTEGEIVNAIHRPLGARTLDGVKKRTRAGMGRCQSGFCSPRVVDILARELKVERTDITKFGGHSNILIVKDKEQVK